MTIALLDQLGAVNAAMAHLLSGWDDDQLRRQYHPDLSPMGWHFGHVAAVEAYWLCEVVADEPLDGATKRFYFPEMNPKPQRNQLPPKAALVATCEALRTQARAVMMRPNLGHELLRDQYILRFLLQHHWQHYETMQQIRHQKALTEGRLPSACAADCAQSAPRAPGIMAGATQATIGWEAPDAFDNERGVHDLWLPPFRIASRPVSNAEYLQFIRDGGYDRPEHWTVEGWQWRQATGASAPDHWRATGTWFCSLGVDGVSPLVPGAPVYGVSYHEASAFARYAGCRLPTENEWEYAASAGLLAGRGEVWEWCANPLYPYPGFRPFPYRGYSLPWCDGRHYVLRGGSRYTGTPLRRPSFRNFYTADKRHVFAGLRLAADRP